MMGFSEPQNKMLAAKLAAKNVKTREKNGLTLSYIEGWHVIAEANRIFGFDGWDRETVHAKCIWHGTQGAEKACSYVAQVRIKVRAGDKTVIREGSGFGLGRGSNLGEAHENALKEAETDAMKRALSTFGNPFGLALYDKEKRGVRGMGARRNEKPLIWPVLNSQGRTLSKHTDPAIFCSALRVELEVFNECKDVSDFWTRNRETVDQLRSCLPNLKVENGKHYADILGTLYTDRLKELREAHVTEIIQEENFHAASGKTPIKGGDKPRKEKTGIRQNADAQRSLTEGQSSSTKFVSFQKTERRVRDKEHLKFVASQTCMVCGRFPSQAHHVRHAQPRALGRKVSDEWTVPLCAVHHRNLHDRGDEKAWWEDKKLDPIKEAERLWRVSRDGRQAV